MSYYLYKLLYDPETTLSFFRLFGYLSFRSIFAFATAFFVSIIFGKKIIKYLLKNLISIDMKIRFLYGLTK